MSLNNPHDIGWYKDFFTKFACKSNPPVKFAPDYPIGPCDATEDPVVFEQGTDFYGALPTPWNFESKCDLFTAKPELQRAHHVQHNLLGLVYEEANCAVVPGASDRRVEMLNLYNSLIKKVDDLIGRVVQLLDNSDASSSTIVVFTSDHGEYCCSHGLRGKAGAVYDEGIHVPLYVRFPGTALNEPNYRTQICSSVDFLRMIAEFGRGDIIPDSEWDSAPDYTIHKGRESLLDFVRADSGEKRQASVRVYGVETSVPYIIHTTDEESVAGTRFLGRYADVESVGTLKSHAVSLRLKTNRGGPLASFTGAKYARYHRWDYCLMKPVMPAEGIPAGTYYDEEWYDYYLYNIGTPQNPSWAGGNRGEIGNNINTQIPGSQLLRDDVKDVLGNYDANGNLNGGLLESELNAALPGNLPAVQAVAFQELKAYLDGCTS